MGRRIAATFVTAIFVAALGWPTAAFATLEAPNAAFVGTNSALVQPCSSTILTGVGFQPNEFVTVTLGKATLGTASSGSTGSFSTSLKVPVGTAPGTYTLESNGATGSSSSTDLTVGKQGCRDVPLLSHSTLVPGESTELHGEGCVSESRVVLTLGDSVVGQTTANSQGMFSASIIPHGYKIGQETVTVSCGSRTFGVLLAVVSTAVARTPESTTAVFGVFVLLGLVLLWGQFGSSASRRRRKHQGA
jgi:large repetitive protein